MDLRLVRVQNVVPATDYDFVTTLLIRDVDNALSVRAVAADGESVPFIVGSNNLNVMLPSGKRSTRDVSTIAIVRALSGGGTTTELLTVNTAGDRSQGATGRVTAMHATLVIRVDAADTAEQVWVNGKQQAFGVISRNLLLASFPVADQTIDTIEVIVPSAAASSEALFSYSVGTLDVVSGPLKLVQQFVSCLLTTPGSDIFDPPSLFAGIDRWVGASIPESNPQYLHAQLVVAVQTTATTFIARQSTLSIPPDEKLASASIASIDSPPDSPTTITITLRISTMSGQVVQFSSLLSAAKAVAAAALG